MNGHDADARLTMNPFRGAAMSLSTPGAVFLAALAIIVARIAWARHDTPTRRRQRAAKRAQRALEEVQRG
jgi:hypothetical protein